MNLVVFVFSFQLLLFSPISSKKMVENNPFSTIIIREENINEL